MLHVCQIFLPLAYIHGKRIRIGLYEYSSPMGSILENVHSLKELRMATHLSPQPASPRGDNVSEVSFQVPETYGSWQSEILRSPVDRLVVDIPYESL